MHTVDKLQSGNYILWIYRKIRKRIPMLLGYAALSAAVAYAGVRFLLDTKSVLIAGCGHGGAGAAADHIIEVAGDGMTITHCKNKAG